VRLNYPQIVNDPRIVSRFLRLLLLLPFLLLFPPGSLSGQATLEQPAKEAARPGAAAVDSATSDRTPDAARKSENAAEKNDQASISSVLARVSEDIRYLASDELGGRKPGSEGIEKAARYIENIYKQIGLEPLADGSYRQKFEVRLGMTVDRDASVLKLLNRDEEELAMELDLGKDYMPQALRRGFDLDAGLVFVGYGINAEEDYNYNEYRDVDVDGKIVVLIRREPQQQDENSVFDGVDVSSYSYIQTKVRAARDAGAAGIIMVNDRVSAPDEQRDTLEPASRFRVTMPFMQIKRKVFDALLKQAPLRYADGKKFKNLAAIEQYIDDTLSPISQPFENWRAVAQSLAKQSTAETSNIVGVIEGEGPHADETIIIGGHYDHLGMGGAGSRSPKREIHNGADDNATGTAAVLELARRFAARDKKPARRLVFVCFSAEEMGLLGAYHYTSAPIFPLDRTAVMVNFDMIGWLREEKVTVFNANSAPEFSTLLDRANEGIDLIVNKSSGFGGSDHLAFFQKEIPVMFIHTGLNSTYHTPEDDFETIDCEGAVRVIDYSERIVDELLALKSKPQFLTAQSRRRNRVRLGVSFDEDVENGVKITRVLEGSIADEAGFVVGDIITAIGPEATDKRRQVNSQIRANSGKSVIIKFRRGETQMEKLVELKRREEESEDDG